ncbi:threonine-phosphate decarboxylase [Cetobacterium sp. 2A]|uniref:pyridoxal phosphate-dependent aminotransferase n=1 Tax=Cetobacterium sp. 2A TaxID=2754723 RepID=UPI00163C7614|nr:histidinol-phosphate transaminase [Cetobacterium sp. 2A]MBC2855103.1 threonine-phosphate decarboxylase [Cetobacterium sp. 2A]
MDLHGGNVFRLERDGKINILDYSSNINPLGVPESFKEAVINNFSILEKYPDPEYVELREAIGDYNGISSENVVVGNGATEILFLYMKAIKVKSAMIVSPTFAEYERALKVSGAQVSYFELKESENFKIDVDRLLEEIQDEELVVICNPNNPTGRFISLEDIDKISLVLDKKGKKLFVDEAFIEFIDNWTDKTSILLKRKNIFILRALTKFFALPGVRLGYGLCYDTELLKKISSIREPWSVNSFAELAGKVMLKDEGYIKATELWIEEEKKWFHDELKNIKNIKPYKTESNFILIKLLSMNSKNFRDKMIDEGIVVRDASNFKFLNESFVRLAVKDRDKNKKILEKIEKVVK